MNKKIAICLIGILLLTGCYSRPEIMPVNPLGSEEEAQRDLDSSQISEDLFREKAEWIISQQDDHFIYMQLDLESYILLLLNNDRDIAFYRAGRFPGPNIEKKAEHLIQVSQSGGTGATEYLYYDTLSDTLSDWYYNVEALYNGMIAYMDAIAEQPVLVIHDIFDSEKNRTEISRDYIVDSNFSGIKSIAFIDSNTIILSYYTEKVYGGHAITETIHLYEE